MANHPSNRIEAQEQLDQIFTYHAPVEGQAERYVLIREAGKKLAETILACCPGCADTTAAIRKVREAVFTANAAIALEGEVGDA